MSLEPVKVLDHGYVQLVEGWGSDERIVEAARMSTGKGFLGWGPNAYCTKCKSIRWVHSGELQDDKRVGHVLDEVAAMACNVCGHEGYEVKAGDEKLLRYLYENKHATPFEMAGLVIEVQAPIFIFREWHRHRTQSYNEMSGRYIELPELFYVPSQERLEKAQQGKHNKQGSEDGLDAYVAAVCREEIRETAHECFEAYRRMLDKGVAREVARLVLPVNTYSRMRASANLRNWLAFLTLRMDEKAQWEIREYANVVGSLIAARFPRTWELFVEGRAR